jgi:hypothetical protein
MRTLPEASHPAKTPEPGAAHRGPRHLVFSSGRRLAALDASPMPVPCHGGGGVDLALEADARCLDRSGLLLRWRCRPCDLVWRCGGEGD